MEPPLSPFCPSAAAAVVVGSAMDGVVEVKIMVLDEAEDDIEVGGGVVKPEDVMTMVGGGASDVVAGRGVVEVVVNNGVEVTTDVVVATDVVKDVVNKVDVSELVTSTVEVDDDCVICTGGAGAAGGSGKFRKDVSHTKLYLLPSFKNQQNTYSTPKRAAEEEAAAAVLPGTVEEALMAEAALGHLERDSVC